MVSCKSNLPAAPVFHPSPPPFTSEETPTFGMDQCAGFVAEVKIPTQYMSPPSEMSETEKRDVPLMDIEENESTVYSPVLESQEDQASSLAYSLEYLKEGNTPMSPKNARSCRTILTSTQRHESAWPFKTPVDPVVVGAFNYFEIIKSPMDLSTISKRLAHAVYSTVESFSADFRLMLDNCYTYNPPTHDVHKIGRSLDAHIQAQFAKHFPELSTQELMTTSASKLLTDSTTERKKRKIRPPLVYEPDEIPIRKYRDEFDDSSKKRKLSSSAIRKLAEGPIGPELISTLASAVQSLQDQIAQLKSTPESAIPRTSTPSRASKSRRKGPKECVHCKSTNSKIWRSGPLGRATLCEKCGDKYAASKKSKKPLTYDEKVALAIKVGKLSSEKQAMVIDIVSQENNMEGGVVEVEIDKLDQKTLRRLYEFVMMQTDVPIVGTESSDDSDSGESSGSESD